MDKNLISKGKGYKLKNWAECEFDEFVDDAIRRLSKEYTDDIVYKMFAQPGYPSELNEIYNGMIIIYRQPSMYNLSEPVCAITASISRYNGDPITDSHTEYVPITDHDGLRNTVIELYRHYHDEKVMDKLINDYETKRKDNDQIVLRLKMIKEALRNG